MSFLRTQHSRCEGKGAINLVRFSFTCPRPVLAGAGTLQREKLLLTTIKESASESVYHLSSHLSLLLWHLIQTFLVFIDLSDLRSRIFSFYFLSLKKVRKLQIRFQVFIVIFIFISEFNKFVGFLWCQLFIGLSRLIPWQFSSRDEFYWFEKRTSFIAPLFLLLRKRTKRKRARSSWR